MFTIEAFNLLSEKERKEKLFHCCGSTSWVTKLMTGFPFKNKDELKTYSDNICNNLHEHDWLEAFRHHPKIGDIKSLQKKFAATAAWASGEQGKVNEASMATINSLQKGNDDYERKFGFIFIVCATGKTAEEMLDMLNQRIVNDYHTEIKIAATEQNKITHIRIDKLIQ